MNYFYMIQLNKDQDSNKEGSSLIILMQSSTFFKYILKALKKEKEFYLIILLRHPIRHRKLIKEYNIYQPKIDFL